MLIFIDTETGGIDPHKHSLISIGCAAWNHSCGIVDTLELFIKSTKYSITEEAKRINKFDEKAHEQKAMSPKDAITRLYSFCNQYSDKLTCLAGHNTQFDVAFIKKFLRDNHRSYNERFSHRIVDTYSIIRYLCDAQLLDIEISSSASAFKHFNITVEGRHTALGDAIATAELYEKLLKLISRKLC